MKRNKIIVPLPILGVVLATIFVGLAVVITFSHFQAPSEPVETKSVVQQITGVSNEIKPLTSPDNEKLENQVYTYTKPEKALDKKAVSSRNEDTGETTALLSPAVAVSKNLPEKKSSYNERVYSNTLPVDQPEKTVIAKLPSELSEDNTKTFSGSSRGSVQKEDAAENDSLQVNEYENNDSAYQDEEFQDAPVQDGLVSVSRDLSSNGDEADIVLSVNIGDSPPNGLIVKEYIPEGWEVTESNLAYNFDPSTGEIKWLLYGGNVKNTGISYKIVKINTSVSAMSFHGSYLYKNHDGKPMTIQINGDNGV